VKEKGEGGGGAPKKYSYELGIMGRRKELEGVF